ncbi:MAG: VCBS repeat-containing protein [Pseudomonadota bacterium]
MIDVFARVVFGVWVSVCSIVIASAADSIEPTFRVQTSVLPLQFDGQTGASLAFAGRDSAGSPMLGLLSYERDQLNYREVVLPDTAVAIDVGPLPDNHDALFVLIAGAVHALEQFDGELREVAKISSLYRGRSFAELVGNRDFARDIDGDKVADFVVPDFDAMHVSDSRGQRTLDLPSYRRGYEQVVTYKAPTVAAAPVGRDGSVYAVRGNTLLSFDRTSAIARQSTLPLQLSSELERESFYNSYEDIDQNDIVIREMDRFTDVNGDGVPDIVTLETISEGVFDKSTTYRVHEGQLSDGRLTFLAEPDSTLSSRGFQLGVRVAPLDPERNVIVTASVQVGVRAIIGALFSRSVTMRVEIYPPAADGTIASVPSTTIKGRVRFDFSTGQAEFPTIEFGDVDGDGVNDLILKERKRGLSWRRGNSDGSFETRSTDLNATGPADGSDVTLADLTGNGADEVIVLFGRADGADRAGQLTVYRPLVDPS